MLPATLEFFRERRAAIMAVIEDVASIDKKTERAIRPGGNYIDKFFELIEDPDEVQKRLVERCLESATED